MYIFRKNDINKNICREDDGRTMIYISYVCAYTFSELGSDVTSGH